MRTQNQHVTRTHHRTGIAAAAAAGILWGLSVPLSKLAMGWLGPAWLTVARFALAAPVLAVIGRRGLRAACTPAIFGSGVLGFGGVVLLQNAGVQRTSVAHAAVIVGAVPVLAALIEIGMRQTLPRRSTWGGYALALFGMTLVAGGHGGGASTAGDGLVLLSALLSATQMVLQPKLLGGRDAAAVTAVQFAAGALTALPVALAGHSTPPAPAAAGAVIAFAALAVAGTLLPFWLFAYGQARIPVQVAGAFLNLEPLVGAAVGWLAFGNAMASAQVAGAAAVLAGMAVTTAPAGGLSLATQASRWRVGFRSALYELRHTA